MRKLVALSLAVFLAGTLAFSQDEPAAVSRAKKKGLLFTVSGLGDFGVKGNLLGVSVPTSSAVSQDLAGLGLKYYLSPKMAIRGALHLGYTQVDTNTAAGTQKVKTTVVGFAPGLEYHFVNTKAVTAYFGGAAAFGLFKSSTPTDPSGNSPDLKFQGIVYSLALLMGVEFFLAENLSLGAEYQLGASATSGKYEGSFSRDLPKTLSLGIHSIAATLALYW
jgi:opacity protein-like surface antigen